MTFFPHFGGEISPLFQLLDDYDVHRSSRPKNHFSPVRSFSPKFDVREQDNIYHLDGELPGVDQNDIEIEFTDPNTLVIKGRVERNYNNTDSNEIDSQTNETADGASSPKSHQATVEDDDESDSSAPATTVKPSGKAAVKTASPAYKYWASERSIGEFHRTFSFPTRIDQDSVRASLKNGILSVQVPKEPTPKLKKIRVE